MPPGMATSGLSVEELRRMEGEERVNVEARIQCLQDINTLLTAAFTQMNQYTSLKSQPAAVQPGPASNRAFTAPGSCTIPQPVVQHPAVIVQLGTQRVSSRDHNEQSPTEGKSLSEGGVNKARATSHLVTESLGDVSTSAAKRCEEELGVVGGVGSGAGVEDGAVGGAVGGAESLWQDFDDASVGESARSETTVRYRRGNADAEH